MTGSQPLTLTIVFADIAGSTRLYEKLGDAKALALVNACNDKIQAIIEANQGSVIKKIGDEVMCRFSVPDKAVDAAVAMHEQMASDPSLASHSIQLRIGLHHGPAIEEIGDLYGDAVNVAARMVGQAKAGQIITTGATVEKMAGQRRQTARLVDQTRVKGKSDILEIYEIAWGQPEELTLISTHMSDYMGSPCGKDAFMLLHFKERKLRISQKAPVLTIGREKTNHLVIEDPRVSRLHARIELRRDKFVLIDQSTNGTYILPGDGEVVLMRRDEFVLPQNGVISLGQQPDEQTTTAIIFEIA